MLEVTFLGHQSWMVEGANGRLLIDPLLVEEFGHRGVVGRLYPPRLLNIAALPPIDAVVLTHEHEDHFSIPSLNRISRAVPIYIPERSSAAMRTFLSELGFTISLLRSGVAAEVRGLRFIGFCADHTRTDELDEWDTMPFVACDAASGDAFFSSVDVSLRLDIETRLPDLVGTPGLWSYTNNVMSTAFQDRNAVAPAPHTQLTVCARFLNEHARLSAKWGPPAASLICGSGFSFVEELAWLNRRSFPVDCESIRSVFSLACPQETFLAPVPGQSIALDARRVLSVRENSAFLRTLPRDAWPDRGFTGEVPLVQRIEPACGRTELDAAALGELTERLAEFAAYLYGTQVFRGLYSLTAEDLEGRRPACVIALLTPDGSPRCALEYEPQSCRFVPVDSSNPATEYFTGMECYGSDLLELLRGRLSPSALLFGRSRRWRLSPARIPLTIDRALWMFSHPLRRPEAFLSFYRWLFAFEPESVPQVLGRRRV